MWLARDPTTRKNGIGNVFVKNLNESVDNAKLHELFETFGNILSCKVAMSEDTKSKGFGLVIWMSNAFIDQVFIGEELRNYLILFRLGYLFPITNRLALSLKLPIHLYTY